MCLTNSYQKLHGTLEVYFRGVKGHAKVARGDYCLVRTTKYGACKRIVTESDLILARRPGALIPMYIRVDGFSELEVAISQEDLGNDVQICPQCHAVNYTMKKNMDLLHWYSNFLSFCMDYG